MGVFLSLAAGTFVSEDLAVVAAGLLIQQGEIDPWLGVAACTIGIFLGDVILWVVGRTAGEAALRWPRVADHLKSGRSAVLRDWLARRAAVAIVASRFLPGTRLPLYVVAGVLGVPGRLFAVWAFVAAALWTPALVFLTAYASERVAALTSGDFDAWLPAVVVVAAVLLPLRGTSRAIGFPRIMRARQPLVGAWREGADALRRRFQHIAVRLQRWSRWEFWPMWLFYAPVTLHVALLAWRYRGLTTITAANPGIADGGTVGESKFDILSRLPADAIVPTLFIPSEDLSTRLGRLDRHMEAAGWAFPLVLKPDVGQRGAGVKVAHGRCDVEQYLTRVASAVIVQPYHPGPFEAGVFYYRMPDWTRGRILSITDKQFPVIVGDGVSSLEALIWAHPRYRLQADTFLARHAPLLGCVLRPAERFQLAFAGNHAQGTTFENGAHLMTPALERRIDEIARSFDGFFVGRFDIRYRDVEAFKAGRGLAIVELNGATGEPTHIYDPRTTLIDAYRQLFRHWSLVFAIGHANRRGGAPVSSPRRLAGLVRAHLTTDVPYRISD